MEYCAGRRSAFVKDECEGSIDDKDEQNVHHCVNCGWMSWVCKGLSCDLCNDYYCACCYQHSFTMSEHCAEIDEEESKYDDKSLCAFCAVAHIACDHDTCVTHITKLAKNARTARDMCRNSMAEPEPPKSSRRSALDTSTKKRKLDV